MLKLTCSWKIYYLCFLLAVALFSSCKSLDCKNGICTDKLRVKTENGLKRILSTYLSKQMIIAKNSIYYDTVTSKLKDRGFNKIDSCSCSDSLELWFSGVYPKSILKLSDTIGGLDDGMPLPRPIATPNFIVDLPKIKKLNKTKPVNQDTLRITSQDTIKVAIVDTGIDPEVKIPGNILFESRWKSANLSQNCNQVTGDLSFGYNAIDISKPAIDSLGHGTHVHGILAGVPENDFMQPKVINDNHIQYINIKFIDKGKEKGNLFDAICGMHYALDQGARIFNLSWGYLDFNTNKFINKQSPLKPPFVFDNFMKEAHAKGALIIAGIGNNKLKLNDDIKFWPASFAQLYDNVISVGALETRLRPIANVRWLGSNWASDNQLTIFAPGTHILSAYPNSIGRNKNAPQGKASMSGTSMAAPMVTRTAAIIWSIHPEWTATEVKAYILNNATDSILNRKILNHKKVLCSQYPSAPACQN